MKSPCFFVFALMICITPAVSESVTQDSYTKHCSSLLPRYNVTARSDRSSLPSLSTSYFSGGKRFQGRHPDRAYSYDQKNLRLRLQSDPYKTTADGVYKVDGFLRFTFKSSGFDDAPGQRPHFRFPVDGFWSEKSRTLCMVGSISWEAVDYEAVLKLKFDDESPTIYTGVVSGSLESTASADDEAYFDPILIFDFPTYITGYNYLQVSEEIGAAFSSRRGESLSLDSNEFCSVMERGLMSLELEYAAECAEQQPRPHHCSPVSASDDFLPNYVSVISVQCAKGAKKARFLAMFQNYANYGYYNFLPSSTVTGEAWWDEKSNGIIGVACPILNPSLHFGNAVGDCTVRLSLRFPSVLTMRNDARIVGEIWSFRAAAEGSDYFRQINLTINEHFVVEALVPDKRYKYTELERVRKSCPQKKAAAEVAGTKKGGDDVYPDAQSFEMRFDLNVQSNLASAYATPLMVENDPFKGMSKDILLKGFSQLQKLDSRAEKWDITQPTKMSYKITVQPSSHAIESRTNVSIPSHIWPVRNPSGEVAIKAEGFYDARNGQLCMVGCRKLAKNSVSTFKDCELVVELELPPLKGGRGRLIKGILRSTRLQTDPLHFDDLVMESFGYNGGEATRSLWRMDMEIAMVLISSTLLCTFVALQIFHLKRNPEVVSSVSLFMLVVLCAGHVIPLVLNVEAMFSDYHDKTTVDLGNGGRLEANEVAVRVITLVALLLQLRLLQLVSTSKNLFSAEWRAGFVSASFYVLGCLLTLMLRNTHSDWRYSAWGYLRSYCGVILDGFLLPQILLNIFRGSAEKALRRSFYVGTSVVRLAPHVYNQYRCHNYPKYDLKQTYYYANPAADMYSTAWDIIIPCGIIALSVIVSLQQRKGGRCILPQRFSVLEKVPAPDNN